MKKCIFWPFLNPILAILCVKWAKMAPFGGSRGSKVEFLGPKTNQDPMNNVFEQKILAGKNFSDPGPQNEKNSEPGRPGPARACGHPKGGPDRSVGVSNPSKMVGHPQKK